MITAVLVRLLLRLAHALIARYEPHLALVPVVISAERVHLAPDVSAIAHGYQWRLAVMVWCFWAHQAGSCAYAAMRAASGDRSAQFRRGWTQTAALLEQGGVLSRRPPRGYQWRNGLTPRIVSQWMRDDASHAPPPLPFPAAPPEMLRDAAERGTAREKWLHSGTRVAETAS